MLKSDTRASWSYFNNPKPIQNPTLFPSPFVRNSQSVHEHGKNPHFWIIDTGATDHITFDITSFITYKSIVPVHVSLPNGSHFIASISGSIALTSALVLHNVLYIPSFHVKLLSIAKLYKVMIVLFILLITHAKLCRIIPGK